MRTYDTMRELAELHPELQFIETTDNANGYAYDLEPALIGFDSFEDADAFAQEHGLQTMVFHKRDGWQLYQRGTIATEAFNLSADNYGDDYEMFTPDVLAGYYENEVKPCLGDFNNMDELADFIEQQQKIMDELEMCDEGDAVITYCGKWYDTIKVKTMEWYHDSRRDVIGVIF